MPLDQHVEGGHGECEPRLKIRPHAVHDPLEMTDECQHGEHRLDQHTVLPLTARTQFEVGRIALRGMEGRITAGYATSEVHCWPFLLAPLRTGLDTCRIIRLSGF